MSTTENRGQFGSKLGFILSAAGSAVGLGNIWKFPGKAYNCGGGAFLLVYIIMVALIGTTVMMAEFTVGRNAHKNALGFLPRHQPEMGLCRRSRRSDRLHHPLLLLSGWRLDYEIHLRLHCRSKDGIR